MVPGMQENRHALGSDSNKQVKKNPTNDNSAKRNLHKIQTVSVGMSNVLALIVYIKLSDRIRFVL